MNKMKEEHMKSREKEQQLVDEIERLKKKLNTQTSSTNLRQNKGKYQLFFLFKINFFFLFYFKTNTNK